MDKLITTMMIIFLVSSSGNKTTSLADNSDNLAPSAIEETGSMPSNQEIITPATPTTTSKTTTTTAKTTVKTTTKEKTTKKSTTTKKTTTKSTTKKTTTKITTPVNLTEEKAYQILLDLKKEYPEGRYWGDNTWSSFHGGNYSGGWGCVGFTYMASDRIFGNLPVKRITDFSKVRVGDIFRYQTPQYGHSVIVLEVKSDRIVVGEGNWQDKVHWGREITFDYMKKNGKYIYTRWP